MTLLTSRDTLENSSLLLTDRENGTKQFSIFNALSNPKLPLVDTDHFFAHTARLYLLVLFQVYVSITSH